MPRSTGCSPGSEVGALVARFAVSRIKWCFWQLLSWVNRDNKDESLRVLACADKGEFVIDDIEFDVKHNKVIVSGPFDPDKLADKLCCKACKIIKEIEIVDLPPPPPPPAPEPEPEPPKKEEPQPPPPKEEEKPEPPPAVIIVEPPAPAPEPEPEPPKKEPPPPPPPKQEPCPPPPKVVEVPYPWPYPYPFPSWPSDCCCHHGHGGCHCCSCGKAPAPPPPQYIPCYPPQQPYPCGGYRIVCEEDPSYACAIM